MRFDPALFSGDDCRVVAEELARTEKACAAGRALAAARVAECGSFRQGGRQLLRRYRHRLQVPGRYLTATADS